VELPSPVVASRQRAAEIGFAFSCEDEVGRLLAVLAATVPAGGRILEIGTGMGVAWPGSSPGSAIEKTER
jgi:predicted O-methyltransferase YrrM